jgi:[2Fe-2S] binding domain
VLSCLTLAAAVREEVTTIEGLSPPEAELHPMQQAFLEHDAFQCGYCTPGQILSAIACVHEKHAGNDDQIRKSANPEHGDARRQRAPAHTLQLLPRHQLRRLPQAQPWSPVARPSPAATANLQSSVSAITASPTTRETSPKR